MTGFRPVDWLLGAAGIGVLLAVWQALAGSGLFNSILLPSPAAVALALYGFAAEGSLWRDMMASLWRVCAGFLLSLSVAVPLGILIGLFPLAKRSVGPVFLLLRPIPPIAWIPLSILWFGIGSGPAYFLTMIASFFPILVNTVAGVEGVDRRHVDVARSFGAPSPLVFRAVILPASLPFIFTGCRIGFGVAWMAVIAAELVASHSGLGYLIHTSQDMLRTDHAMAGMVSIGALGLLFDFLFFRARAALIPWDPSR